MKAFRIPRVRSCSIIGRVKARIRRWIIKRRAQRLNISYNGNILLGRNIQNWGGTSIRMGNGSRIGDNTVFWGGGIIEIGKDTSIGENTWIFASGNKLGGVVIGDDVECAANLYIIDSNHLTQRGVSIRKQGLETKKITIGDGAWIGVNVTIIPGASLGPGCVVGACSLVNKSFEAETIIGGVPAKILKEREK